jgi:hypothetical protein
MSDIVVVNVGDRVATVQTVNAFVELMFPGIQGPPGATGGAFTTLTGMLKGDGVQIVVATLGTDYAPGTASLASGLLKSTTTTGALSIATLGTDYAPGTSALGTGLVKTSGGVFSLATSADVAALVLTGAYAYLNVSQLWLQPQRPHYTNSTAITATGSFAYDPITNGQVCLVTLTNAITVTFSTPGDIVEGTMYKFILKAGDTAARTFAWSSAYKFPAATPTLLSGTTTSGAFDVISFMGGVGNTLIYDGSMTDVR